jgi:hypothetical protein
MNKNLLKNQNNSPSKAKFWKKALTTLLFLTLLSVTQTQAQISFSVTGGTQNNATPALAISYNNHNPTKTN